MTAKDTETQNSTTPEGWRPSEGDVLTGKVVEVAKGWSDYTDSYYPIVTIEEDETGKQYNVHCFHEILKERMLDARPEVGTPLSIECTGERKTRDGKRSYVGYRVTVPGETGERVWDDLGSQGKRASTAARTETTEDDIPF